MIHFYPFTVTPTATKLKFNSVNGNSLPPNQISLVFNSSSVGNQTRKEGPNHYYNFTSLGDRDSSLNNSSTAIDTNAKTPGPTEDKYGRKIFAQIHRLMNDSYKAVTPANTAKDEADQYQNYKQPQSVDHGSASPVPMDSTSRVSSPIYYTASQNDSQHAEDPSSNNKENANSSILKRPKTAKKNVKTSLSQSTFANQSASASSTSTVVGANQTSAGGTNNGGLNSNRKPSTSASSTIYFPNSASATFLGNCNCFLAQLINNKLTNAHAATDLSNNNLNRDHTQLANSLMPFLNKYNCHDISCPAATLKTPNSLVNPTAAYKFRPKSSVILQRVHFLNTNFTYSQKSDADADHHLQAYANKFSRTCSFSNPRIFTLNSKISSSTSSSRASSAVEDFKIKRK